LFLREKERNRMNTCTHASLKIVKRSIHVDEFSIVRGKAERDLNHTHPVHEIYVRCPRCPLEETYDPRHIPEWLQPYLDLIAEIERKERLTLLLAEITDDPIDLTLLDMLLDVDVPASVLVGKLADWHGDPFPIVQLDNGRIAIAVTLTCTRCKIEQITAYAGSGCHTGAFCYIFTQVGEYQADLRNQEYVCETCQEERAARAS
jgi:hypothetical protein